MTAAHNVGNVVWLDVKTMTTNQLIAQRTNLAPQRRLVGVAGRLIDIQREIDRRQGIT